MRTIYGNPGYTYAVPVDQGPYGIIIAGNAIAIMRSQAEAVHTRLNENILIYKVVCTGTNNLTIYAAGKDTVTYFKKRYIVFGDTTNSPRYDSTSTYKCLHKD